jgi:hypothetical protein
MDGKIRRIGSTRSIVLDVIHCARRVPSFPVERKFLLGELSDLRYRVSPRISWSALFLRAYGLASREHPFLRQIFVAWPWPRIYQSPECVISVAVNRSLPTGERLFFGRLKNPDCISLVAIQRELDRFQTNDPARIFLSQWRGAKLPTWLRRLAWWWRMEVDYRNRSRRVGTASMSVLAGQGVTNRLHPCMLTSSLSYGPLESDGQCLLTLQCDHRVIDGVDAARALNSIGEYLTQEVYSELAAISSSTDSIYLVRDQQRRVG